MSYSSAFKTRTEIIQKKNLDPPNIFPIALDIGYSAVKGFSPGSVFCFPSFAKVKTTEVIGTPKPSDILYKGEDGVEYVVGSMAVDSISSKDTNEATNTLYNRNRYFSPTFLIIARVGMAIGMTYGQRMGKEMFLQTGLPPAYRKADTPLLVEALSGRHRFSVKIGFRKWQTFDFELPATNISVIDQPIGSVYSASKAADGSTVTGENGKPYIDSKLLVLDGGFGTLDMFSIINRAIDGTNTFNDLGMKAVFEHTVDDIFTNYGKEIHVHTIQKYLESGKISVLNRKTKSTAEYDLGELLEKNNRLVCETAMERIESAYNDLEDYEYLLVTGGTGAAWLDMIKERYKNMSSLKIITGNQNEDLDHIYSNVRGYYIFRALKAMH